MTQQIIILEGIDMVGKTTISKKLSETLLIPVYREVHRDKWYDHTIDMLYAEEARIQMLEQLKFSVIMDRSYPSEYAYAKAYDRPLLEQKIWEYDKRYNALNAFIVYLYKPKAHWQKDKTDLIEIGKYEKIDFYFREFLSKTHCAMTTLDTSNENVEEQVLNIIEKGQL